MKVLLTLLAIISSSISFAQHKCVETENDFGVTMDCHFKSGELSTREFMDAADRFGKATAYNIKGEVIFEKSTRRIGGHASVYFSYHENGAVSKAEFSDAPDGGIQWYKSVTTFDENGVQTWFHEMGYDERGLIPPTIDEQVHRSPVDTVVVPAPPAPDPAVCQMLHSNVVYLVNETKHGARAKVVAKNPSPMLSNNSYNLLPGDTVLVGSYSIGEMFDMPDNHMSVELERVELKKRRKPFKPVLEMHIVQALDGTSRDYYLSVVRWKR
ncbi:MAG: hypothetical protein RL220_748 [Bacteroidota bacterium]|jgi:hypothetical protein